jgi:dTDP-4-dehydrorhamnose 3,5-epimerase
MAREPTGRGCQVDNQCDIFRRSCLPGRPKSPGRAVAGRAASTLTGVRSRALSIAGAWVFSPSRFDDDRGLFVAPYQEEAFVAAVGRPITLAQSNHSVSRRGVIRGVHFADVPPGQAKYVYCPHGALLDVVVDVRVGSPTFGRHEAVRLDSDGYRAIYLSEGLGHAFCALTDDTVASYLCSTPYAPAIERAVTPLDPELGLPWPEDIEPVLSAKDRDAPTLAEATGAGLLPRYRG